MAWQSSIYRLSQQQQRHDNARNGFKAREEGEREVGEYNGSGGGGVYLEGKDDMGVRCGRNIFPIFLKTH